METLKIEIPKGYEIDSFDLKAGEIKFKSKPQKVTDRIKTVADVLADHGIGQIQFAMQCSGLTTDEINYRILKMLTKSLNEGWTPNWNDSNQPKYFPYFEMGGSSGFRFNDYDLWRSCSSVGSRLCFKTYELAEYAGRQFTDAYKQFMTI